MIRFNLPDFVIGRQAYLLLHSYICNYPEIFYPKTEISSVFGIFGSAIWNGGSYMIGDGASREFIEDTIAAFNEINIPLRFTFTNPLITGPMCFDTFCNNIAEAGHNGKNQILVCSPILEKYLRKTYPNYKYCRSILAAEKTPYDLKDGEYFLSVLQRAKNNDWNYLNTIPIKDRPHIELLCNDPCPDNCPRIYEHYLAHAKSQISGRVNEPGQRCTMIGVKGEFPVNYMRTNNKTYISRHMIDSQYAPNGFQEFKISGRGCVENIILNPLDYMILPEFRHDVAATLIRMYL